MLTQHEHEPTQQSPRGNLVDGLPRAASLYAFFQEKNNNEESFIFDLKLIW